MAKPTHPKWIPDGNSAYQTDPGEAKRALGFIYQEKPPFQYFNWGLYNFSEWIKGLQGGYFDIIVGSSTQVTDNEATHEIADLDNALVVAGSKVLFLAGTHTLAANLALSNADVMFFSESPLAIIAVSTYEIQLSGARAIARLRVTGAGANDIKMSGAGSHFEGIDVDIASVQATAGATARTSGLLGGIKFSDATYADNKVMTIKAPEVFTGQKNFSPSIALTWGANVAWNLDTRQVAKLTLTDTTAELDNPTNMKDGGTYVLRVIQDGTGGRALTFGSAYRWPNGIVPVVAQGIDEESIFSFISDGANMDGVMQGPFS